MSHSWEKYKEEDSTHLTAGMLYSKKKYLEIRWKSQEPDSDGSSISDGMGNWLWQLGKQPGGLG